MYILKGSSVNHLLANDIITAAIHWNTSSSTKVSVQKMVLILHKELVKPMDWKSPSTWSWRSRTQISSMWINHTGSIHMHEVLQSWSPNTVYQLLLELRGIRGGKGAPRRQGKREGPLIWERGLNTYVEVWCYFLLQTLIGSISVSMAKKVRGGDTGVKRIQVALTKPESA